VFPADDNINPTVSADTAILGFTMVVSPRVHRSGPGPLRRAYDHYSDASV
jgi:hypothetical protein